MKTRRVLCVNALSSAIAVLSLLMSGNSFAQSAKYVSCDWADKTDYFVYEIDDNNEKFRFMTTFEYGTDSLSLVPHGESDNFREFVVTFSKSKIEHCRLNKKKDVQSCYSLNRINGSFTYTYGDRDPKVSSCKLGLPEAKF